MARPPMANDKWLAWPPVSGMVVGFDTYSRTTRRFLSPVEVSVPERASLPAASPAYRYPPSSGGWMLHLSPMRRTVPDHVLSTVPVSLSTAFALSVQRRSSASTDGPKVLHGSIYGSDFGGMAL